MIICNYNKLQLHFKTTSYNRHKPKKGAVELSLIFKEYTVKFEDGGRFYNVTVCRCFPKSRAFAGKLDGPNASTGTAIHPVSIRTNTWKELMDCYRYMVSSSIHKLKRHLVKELGKERCPPRGRRVRRGIEKRLKKYIVDILHDELSQMERHYESDS